MRLALIGNPNSGKTTMFNALTGRNEKVGNWAGVTVDAKAAPLKIKYSGNCSMTVVDLPGAYSMSPFTAEESVTREYILTQKPDVIVNIVDATNLSRSLFFTTQLLDLGIPVVVALNKADVNAKKGTVIDEAALAKGLGCPVISTVSTAADGLAAVVDAALAQAGRKQVAPYQQGTLDLNDRAMVIAADKRRFAFVERLVKASETGKVHTGAKTAQDKLDIVLTNPVIGLVIFAAVMFLVFQLSQAWLGVWIAEGVELPGGVSIPGLVTLMDAFKEWVGEALAGGHPFLVALLTEGVIGGVSAVVGFLPLVMVMYFLIALLEDCGYMARATVVLDPLFKKVGLSGKSVIPFVVGTGCAVPGVMACRTIRDERERRVTAMLTPFMPCGAKLPIIGLFAGAFFGEASWVGTLMYFIGIAVILLGALLVNRIVGYKRRSSYFIIELPEYRVPSVKRATLSMLDRGWSYVVKAGTIILLCNAVVYSMQSFDWSLALVGDDAGRSILASIAQPVAVALVPIIGVAAWQMAAAAVTGFIAKENVVGTLAVCYGVGNLIDTEALEMAAGAGSDVATVFGITKVAALAFLMFNLFSPPCFAAIGAMNAELKDKAWLWGGIALQLAVGYCIGFAVYQGGTYLTTGTVGAGFAGGLIAVTMVVAVLAVLCVRGGRKERKQPWSLS